MVPSTPCHEPIKRRVATIDYFLRRHVKSFTYGYRVATIVALVDNTEATLTKYRNVEKSMPELGHVDMQKFFTRYNLLLCIGNFLLHTINFLHLRDKIYTILNKLWFFIIFIPRNVDFSIPLRYRICQSFENEFCVGPYGVWGIFDLLIHNYRIYVVGTLTTLRIWLISFFVIYDLCDKNLDTRNYFDLNSLYDAIGFKVNVCLYGWMA